MKKILFLSFAALCFAVTVNAQSSNGDHRGGGRGGNQQFYQSLNLTPQQQAQFHTIDSTQHVKMQALGQGASREDRMAIMKDGNAQKRALLTSDQQTKWDEHQAEMQKRMQERMQQHQQEQSGNAPAPQSGN